MSDQHTSPHDFFMQRAIEEAEKAKGQTAPNPAVGAVFVQHGEILAVGHHAGAGQKHAEAALIDHAKANKIDLSNGTLYVTLEPCNHTGRTPPCTEAIIKAGIPEVVIGTLDPNPHVTGGGMLRLEQAGIDVVVGVEEDACRDLIADFCIWTEEKRPFITLKMAATLDGKIATRTGRPADVSGPGSRERVQFLRCQTDAVLVGKNTFLQDDPRLSCRLPDYNGKQPLAVIVGSKATSAFLNKELVKTRAADCIFLLQEMNEFAHSLQDLGATVWPIGLKDGLYRLFEERQVHYLLCEGGGTLAQSLVTDKMCDLFHLHMAPKSLGDAEGRNLFSGLVRESMTDADNWRITRTEQVGDDLHLLLKPR